MAQSTAMSEQEGSGRIQRVRLRESDIQDLMALFKKYRKTLSITDACERVAHDMNLDPKTVYSIQRRFRPTTDIATDYIKGNALKLAMRVVKKANVDQAIGILSRPNIGVLEQASSGGDSGKGFVIGVAVDSLGGVKVGVGIGTDAARASMGVGLPTAPAADIVEPAQAEAEAPLELSDGLDDDEEAVPIRKWHTAEPRKKPLEKRMKWANEAEGGRVPKEPGREFGQGFAVREARKRAEIRAETEKRRKDRRIVNARMKEMEAELKRKV